MKYDERLKAVVVSVIAHLKGWRFDEITARNSGSISIVGEAGARVSFSIPYRNGGRVAAHFKWPVIAGVSYTTPRYWGVLKSDEEVPSLNFSPDRNPKNVANALNKILPNYVDLYRRCLVERQKEIDRREHEKNIIDAFAKVKQPSYKDKNNIMNFYDFGDTEMQATVEVRRDTTCDLSLNRVPPDLAMRIIALCS